MRIVAQLDFCNDRYVTLQTNSLMLIDADFRDEKL